MDRLAELLARGPVLFDGAMGTELLARGAAPDRCLEELNLAEPVLVSGVHRDYIAAGARLAVEARNASGRPVLVAGSIGPLGRPLEPVGAIKRAAAERLFREQV